MQIEVTDDIRTFGQSFLYRHRIQLFLFCGFSFDLYADLPIALTIVHCDGTSILSLLSHDQPHEPTTPR
jgi:hypothetical protein